MAYLKMVTHQWTTRAWLRITSLIWPMQSALNQTTTITPSKHANEQWWQQMWVMSLRWITVGEYVNEQQWWRLSSSETWLSRPWQHATSLVAVTDSAASGDTSRLYHTFTHDISHTINSLTATRIQCTEATAITLATGKQCDRQSTKYKP